MILITNKLQSPNQFRVSTHENIIFFCTTFSDIDKESQAIKRATNICINMIGLPES